MASFMEKLESASLDNRSLLCVGLDPDPRQMPVSDLFEFNRDIIDATVDLVCAYKPNLSFYEAQGIPGLEALKRTVEYIHSTAARVPVIGDAKRGELGPSAESYAKAMFDVWGFDAITANAWGGRESLQPFFDREDKGVFVWCRSSNNGAGDIQDLPVATRDGQRPVFELLAEMALGWNGNGNVGLVIGATYPLEMKKVRDGCPDMPFLIPGVGAQGGALEESVRCGANSDGRMAIVSSSRGVLYASGGSDYAQAARQAALELREQMNAVLEQEGKGWS